MAVKNVYICPECKTWQSVTENQAKKGCEKCNNSITYVPIEYKTFKQMNDEEREVFKKNFLQNLTDGKSILGSYVVPVSKPVSEPVENIKASSGWIDGMQAIGWVVFAAFIIVGVLALTSSPDGVLVFLGCILAGFLSVGMTMIFLDMAKDLKAIRAKLEQK